MLSLCIDRSGNLWCGTNGRGLNKTKLNPEKFLHYRHDPNDSGSPRHNSVRAIYQGSDSTLWVGTSAGLDKLTVGSMAFQHVTLQLSGAKSEEPFVGDIQGEDSGHLWLGTFGQGLLK